MAVHTEDFVETKAFAIADARGRITLGAHAVKKQYRISENAKGEVLLTPVISIPENEAWLYQNPRAIDLVRRGLEDVTAGRIHDTGSFAQYADLDIGDE